MFHFYKIPVGHWAEKSINYLTNTFENHFRVVSEFLNDIFESSIKILTEVPPYLFIIFSIILFYIVKRNKLKSFVVLICFFLLLNLGYWNESLETIFLVVLSTFVCCIVGVPIGILASHNYIFYTILKPVLDLMQTIPTFVYLIPTLMLFGLGLTPGLISTVVFAIPVVIRLTYLGLEDVPETLLEVADSFGAGRWKKLFSVELPYAMPAILTGISQCVMLSLSMVVIAALVGADGLGKHVVQSLNTVNIQKGFESGISIVIVAILLDRVFSRNHEPKGIYT